MQLREVGLEQNAKIKYWIAIVSWKYEEFNQMSKQVSN